MKEFNVGGQTITTVKSMMSGLKYMKGVAQKRVTDLAGAGLKQADLDAYDTIIADLDDTDSRQENAKKKQKSATYVRDESMDALRKTMKKIRNKAKVILCQPAGDPDGVRNRSRWRAPGKSRKSPLRRRLKRHNPQ